MSVSEQEKRQTRKALKEEIAYNAHMIEIYRGKIEEFVNVTDGEREVLRCELEILQHKRAIVAAAASLGIKPPDMDSPAPPKRGPGRPPKSPPDA